jgi:hypothetical protein
MLCADVEVQVAGDDRNYIAVFTESGDQDFELTMLLQKAADYDLDWFDNDMHSAFKDVLETRFQDEADENPREQLKEDILSYGDVREQIGKHLNEAKSVKS